MLGRWLLIAFCVADAALLLLCGWLVPIHLSAVDVAVIQQAGENTPSVAEDGLDLARKGRLAAAELLLQAAQSENLPGLEKLSQAVRLPAAPSPVLNPIRDLLNFGPVAAGATNGYSQVITESVLRLENRDRVAAFLQAAPSPAVKELVRCRDLTNTVLFPPSFSSSGQAFDAAVSVCGLLLEEDSLSAGLRQDLLDRAAAALGGGNTQPLEEVLMDMMSLGQRLNWEQLTVFVPRIEDARTLERLAVQARNAGAKLPRLFAAVELSQQPGAVAAYLDAYSQTGLDDLGTSLRFGAGALDELLRRNQRICASDLRDRTWPGFRPGSIFTRPPILRCVFHGLRRQ